MEITLVRHTTVAPEWQTVCYGNTNVPLADTFEMEATKVAREIDASLYDRILSSPLSRALKLAQYCVPASISIEVDDRLREMNFGSWEGVSWEHILTKEQRVSDFFEYFIDQPAPDGGESLKGLAKRIAALITELYLSGAKRVLLFCHGGVINATRAMAGQITLQEAFEQVLPYGSQTVLALDELIYMDRSKLGV